MKLIWVVLIFISSSLFSMEKADLVVVTKKENTLILLSFRT